LVKFSPAKNELNIQEAFFLDFYKKLHLSVKLFR